MKDWELHSSRLHMRPGNAKYQSVYTKKQAPVLEVYKPVFSWPETLTVLGCFALVLLLGWGVTSLFSGQCSVLLNLIGRPDALFACVMR